MADDVLKGLRPRCSRRTSPTGPISQTPLWLTLLFPEAALSHDERAASAWSKARFREAEVALWPINLSTRILSTR
ncbi:hypothetical protein [Prevotella sp.]|uniref:hypothetical protein n=1 Tax=Prevotella sp. TaxID=59823 RepID=UPI002F91D0E9